MGNTSKDFAPLQADYAFFMAQSNEAEADAEAYAREIEALGFGSREVRMLDFGCGPGTFTERVLDRLGWAADRVHLALVEPVNDYRRDAVERLRGRTTHRLRDWPELPLEVRGEFDLVISNHVFYYVLDLEKQLDRIAGALNSSGVFLTAIAGRENALVGVWLEGFAALGRPVPYHAAEDFEEALTGMDLPFRKQPVGYRLAFADSEENRLKILRFLLGEHLALLPRATALGFLDRYAFAGHVVMDAKHQHYAIRPAS